MPNSVSACRLAIAIMPSVVTTICATGLARNASWRRWSRPTELLARRRGDDLGGVGRAGRRLIGDFAEHPPFHVDRREQGGVAQQHLGLAEEEDAVVGQGEVEPAQDPGLGLGVEVHQRVAADEQVDPGDGGVLHEVVAAEDERAPQVLAEDVPVVDLLEVGVEEVGWHPDHLALAVRALAGGGETLVVHVGRVDLDPVPELLRAEDLRHRDGQGVGLFAGRAAGAPDAQRGVGPAGREQGREDLLPQVLPGIRIAEEPGDVDQDGVEEGGELIRMHL